MESVCDESDALVEERERSIRKEMSDRLAAIALEAELDTITGLAQDDFSVKRQSDSDYSDARKHAQWLSMFGIKVSPSRRRKPEPELFLEAAASVAQKCLRDHVTMPASPENTAVSVQSAASGGRLPPVSCAFRHCTWCVASTPSPHRSI